MKLRIWIAAFCFSSAILLANDVPDAFDHVVADIVRGSIAERRGDIRAMRLAGDALLQEGAVATNGSADVAAHWLSKSKLGRAQLQATSVPYRNRALGVGYRTIALAAGASTQFDQTFLAGQRARVAVVPLTKSKFHLTVLDDDGMPVCATAAITRQCDWVPAWTTRYIINIANLSKAKSGYYIVMQ